MMTPEIQSADQGHNGMWHVAVKRYGEAPSACARGILAEVSQLACAPAIASMAADPARLQDLPPRKKGAQIRKMLRYCFYQHELIVARLTRLRSGGQNSVGMPVS